MRRLTAAFARCHALLDSSTLDAMTSFPQQLRRRAVHTMCILVALASAPWVAAEIAPSLSAFVPPPLLSMLLAFSAVDALLLWRPVWFFEKLFPGQPVPVSLLFSGRSLRNQRIALFASALVSGILTVQWLQSLP